MEAMQVVNFKDLLFEQVKNMQIIQALNANVNIDYAEGELYKKQKLVANEARNRGLLLNPNSEGPTAYNWCTDSLKPKDPGWEQVKGIQRRILLQADAENLSMGEVT